MDSFQDEGSLFAVAGHSQAARLAYLGLHGLAHRGQAAVGIACSDGNGIRCLRAPGFHALENSLDQLETLRGRIALGQLTGARVGRRRGLSFPAVQADQPIVVRWHQGQMAVAMAGKLTNGFQLRTELQERGAVFGAASDVEVLTHLIAKSSRGTFINRLVEALWNVKGAFCLTVCTEELLVAVRDPMGFRPLILGNLGQATVIASEDTVLRNFNCTDLREVLPGEMVIVDATGVRSVFPFLKRPQAMCVEDVLQLARNDAQVYGVDVYPTRVALGRSLAKEQPCAIGEVVVGLPGAGVPAALGYSQVSRIPYHRGLERATRGRISEGSAMGLIHMDAEFGIRENPSILRGKNVVVIAPILVSGKTVRAVVRMIRGSGARAVHVRIAAPPVKYSSPYGVVSPTSEVLIFRRFPSLDSLSAWLGSDSLGFLGIDGMRNVLGSGQGQSIGWCETLFTGELPIPQEEVDTQIEMFRGAPSPHEEEAAT